LLGPQALNRLFSYPRDRFSSVYHFRLKAVQPIYPGSVRLDSALAAPAGLRERRRMYRLHRSSIQANRNA
jgi:hypothetical protein